MQGWQLTAANKPLRLVELPDPVPGAGEIVIDPKSAGLCHTDIGFMDGSLTDVLGFVPIILGHEIAGVVSAVGGAVTAFKVGDRVAVKSGVETPGTRSNGGFATKVAAPAEFVAKIPDELSFDHAAVATDGGMTAYHSIHKVGRVAAGQRVGIIGLGGVGWFGAQFAKAAGADVYAVDPNKDARRLAGRFAYADYLSDVQELACLDLDVIVDYAGFGSTTAGAIKAVGQGGRIVQVGLGKVEATISIATLVMREIQLVGSLSGTMGDLAKVLDMLAAGKVEPLTTSLDFMDLPEGLDRLQRGEVRGRLVARISS